MTFKAIHFFLLLFEQISDHSVFFLSHLELGLKFLYFILDLKLLTELFRDFLGDLLNHVLSVTHTTSICFNILIDQMKILVIVMDFSITLHQLMSYFILIHVEGMNDTGFLLDLVNDFLFLLLETFSSLLFTFNFFINSLSFILKLLKVSFEMFNGFFEVLIALSNSHRLVSVFHIVLLESLNLVLVLLLFLFHSDQLSINLSIRQLFFLYLNLNGGDITVYFSYLLSDFLNKGNKPLLSLLLLTFDLILSVKLLTLKQVNLSLKCSPPLLDCLDISVDIVDSILKLLKSLLVLLLLLLSLLKIQHFIG